SLGNFEKPYDDDFYKKINNKHAILIAKYTMEKIPFEVGSLTTETLNFFTKSEDLTDVLYHHLMFSVDFTKKVDLNRPVNRFLRYNRYYLDKNPGEVDDFELVQFEPCILDKIKFLPDYIRDVVGL
ncbi:hypothetical protein HOK68_03750, partial [Candidatus Woesearchaeota archaeon]|nr:hypothetical protein [Candidatus Woesearchaeota archaeon]